MIGFKHCKDKNKSQIELQIDVMLISAIFTLASKMLYVLIFV